jgi:hypothetical protein
MGVDVGEVIDELRVRHEPNATAIGRSERTRAVGFLARTLDYDLHGTSLRLSTMASRRSRMAGS